MLLSVVVVLFALDSPFSSCSGMDHHQLLHLQKRRRPHGGRTRPVVVPKKSAKNNRKTIHDMTCEFIEQPLNHFALPRQQNSTYRQRYCYYNGHVENLRTATVLLYAGNESPLEQYINHTGLMWEMAEAMPNTQIVFVEHRYEGQSLPDPSIPNCMAYSSAIQALADYANLIERVLFRNRTHEREEEEEGSTLLHRRPVIAFGGSYGGMLSAWLRMKYPHLVQGSIAASAPIWGFPLSNPSKIDSAYQVISHGLSRPYPPTRTTSSATTTTTTEPPNHCRDNLLAAWPLVRVLANSTIGRELLTRSFALCGPYQGGTEGGGDDLIGWAQSPWFDLAEGSFPYPSSYIPFALTHSDNATLPAWPLQAACWTESDLHKDYGIVFDGNRMDVRYNIIFGDEGVISVDWENASTDDVHTLATSDNVAALLVSVRKAVSVWFNVTKDIPCYNLTVAPNAFALSNDKPSNAAVMTLQDIWSTTSNQRFLKSKPNSTTLCSKKMMEGSWPSLCCNEDMNLIIADASGLGNDVWWPPSHRRGVSTYRDIMTNASDPFCFDSHGVYGYSQDVRDPWATSYDIVFGGTNIDSHSNIVFSNGLLDPWSAAGVYAKDQDPTPPNPWRSESPTDIAGLYVQNITNNDSMIALIMEYGGHHTDLMYSDVNDPPSIREARRIETFHVEKWVRDFWEVQAC
jgi:pimeloyl-ACP methyl ester carboxylesterase